MGRPRRIAILSYQGVDEFDLAGTLAPLRKAGEAAPDDSALHVEVIGPGPLRGSSGLLITPDRTFADPGDARTLDALVLPGGRGAATASTDPALSAFVRCAHSAGVPFYAVCSGVLILRDLGLLEGLHVASHGQKRSLLAGAGCTVGSGVIRDRWLVSASGFGPGDGPKGAAIGFRLLEDIAPEHVAAVAARLELWPRAGERFAAAAT